VTSACTASLNKQIVFAVPPNRSGFLLSEQSLVKSSFDFQTAIFARRQMPMGNICLFPLGTE
jgi:hypothetical protein